MTAHEPATKRGGGRARVPLSKKKPGPLSGLCINHRNKRASGGSAGGKAPHRGGKSTTGKDKAPSRKTNRDKVREARVGKGEGGKKKLEKLQRSVLRGGKCKYDRELWVQG